MNLVAEDASVYYAGSYWNDYPWVRAEMNRRISNDPNAAWHQHFANTHPDRTFKKALVLNCGNGWVEREIYDHCPIFDEAVGVDFSDELLGQAREHAGKRPFRYYKMDTNDAAFPEDGIDLVINHAACHHIAYIDRVLRELCRMLPEDGLFLNYDYVGPHRNQYSARDWEAAWAANQELPEHLRQDFRYPHLPTMLASDPTEAIHSELILPTTRRYFDLLEHRRVGGAVAYSLLTHNAAFASGGPHEQAHWATRIMEHDHAYLEASDVSYFDYYVGRPRKDVLEDTTLLEECTQIEHDRERAAIKRGGLYYPPTLLSSLYYPV